MGEALVMGPLSSILFITHKPRVLPIEMEGRAHMCARIRFTAPLTAFQFVRLSWGGHLYHTCHNIVMMKGVAVVKIGHT